MSPEQRESYRPTKREVIRIIGGFAAMGAGTVLLLSGVISPSEAEGTLVGVASLAAGTQATFPLERMAGIRDPKSIPSSG